MEFRHRRSPRMTQAELGKLLKVSTPTVSRIETGEQSITPENAVKWGKILGIDESELVFFGIK